METKLAIAAALVLIMLPSVVNARRASPSIGYTSSGEPVYEHPSREKAREENNAAQEKRDQQRFDWQKKDREDSETQAQDARRESAHRESKAAHRSKVKKMRKAAGEKPHNSWQLRH